MRLHRKPERDRAGQTLLEGPHLVAAALAAGVIPRRVFLTAGDAPGRALVAGSGCEVLVVDERTLRRLGTTETPQSPIAVIAVPAGPEPGPRVLAAWGVSDPGNVGTLIRVAAAFGYGYLSGPGSADPWAPKVLRSAAGAHFGTALGSAVSLDEVRRGGRALVATVPRGGGAPGPLPAAAAILVGSEAHGLPGAVVDAADLRVTIPTTPAVESLNAAVAGAIVAYLGWVAAGEPGPPGPNLTAS